MTTNYLIEELKNWSSKILLFFKHHNHCKNLVRPPELRKLLKFRRFWRSAIANSFPVKAELGNSLSLVIGFSTTCSLVIDIIGVLTQFYCGLYGETFLFQVFRTRLPTLWISNVIAKARRKLMRFFRIL